MKPRGADVERDAESCFGVVSGLHSPSCYPFPEGGQRDRMANFLQATPGRMALDHKAPAVCQKQHRGEENCVPTPS